MDLVSGARRVRAFKAADAFAVEAYRVSESLPFAGTKGLIEALRRAALRSGSALVAASAETPGGAAERDLLARAKAELIEGRYTLYLARRLGVLDGKRHRALALRQDAALREIEVLLRAIDGKTTSRPP